VSLVVAASGWCLAALLVAEMRRRAGLIADAAHELRGPLTAISLGIEALRRQPAARHRAEALANELWRMQLAADDAAAAARGRRAAALSEQLVLGPFVERSGAAWMPAAERRGGQVSLDWRAGGASVRTDPRRLAQAFANLLANAVEHGGGEIVVRGRPSRGGVRVEIEDRGAGPRPPSPKLPRARGRGLRIAKRAVEQAGGRLSAFDRPDGGRVAVAELPLDRSR
jgi:two-component system, OmpR family, sensor histidine kinase MtrB